MTARPESRAENLPSLARQRVGSVLTPVVVLAVTLGLTLLSLWIVGRTARSRAASRFENAVQATEDRIHNRLDAYVALLLATRGLFLASDHVSAADFRNYVESLDLARRYPGAQGIGFTRRILPGELEAVEQQQREAGFPGFRVWPRTPRDEYHSITFLEPQDRRNAAAMGYDMFTETTRREAMARARDEAAAALSGRVTLVQEIDETKQAGFLIYLPVYQGSEAPDSVEERRERLVGFVYSPFRARDLFEGIFGTEREPRVVFSVYDGETESPATLLYDSSHEKAPGRALEMHRPLELGGRTWTIAYYSAAGIQSDGTWATLYALGIFGSLAGLILFAATLAQARARRTAEQAQQQAEATIVQLERAEREARDAVQVRNEFLSIASHELKTPLTSLKLQLRLLSQQTPPGSQTARRVEVLGRQVTRLTTLVENLLDVSRLSAGRLELTYEDADLRELLLDVVETVRPEADRSGTRLEVDAPQALPGRWDPLRLEQVAFNLIGNAVKYGGGQPVLVRAYREGAEHVVLEVADRGIGIDPEKLGRIFEPFERAAPIRAFGGLGLGLYITRKIVDRMNATIEVQSAEGQGSRFTVRLPVAPPAE